MSEAQRPVLAGLALYRRTDKRLPVLCQPLDLSRNQYLNADDTTPFSVEFTSD